MQPAGAKLLRRGDSRIPGIAAGSKLKGNRSQTSVGLNLSSARRDSTGIQSSRRQTLSGVPPLSGRQSCASIRTDSFKLK